jgi:xanthosine utilization system XapX-like protein
MSLVWFKIALLFHIIGFLGLFAGMALASWTAWRLQSANTLTQAREGADLANLLPKLFGPSTALVILSGIWLSVIYVHDGGNVGWIVASFVALVFVSALASARWRRLTVGMGKQLKKADGQVTPKLRELMRDKSLLGGEVFGAFLFLGIIVNMIFQPSTAIAVIVLLVGALLGWLAGEQVVLSNSVKIEG